jgi:hypothetical protein
MLLASKAGVRAVSQLMHINYPIIKEEMYSLCPTAKAFTNTLTGFLFLNNH